MSKKLERLKQRLERAKALVVRLEEEISLEEFSIIQSFLKQENLTIFALKNLVLESKKEHEEDEIIE